VTVGRGDRGERVIPKDETEWVAWRKEGCLGGCAGEEAEGVCGLCVRGRISELV
jgi:hypothetical protein